jgi:hypothetical protein
MEQLILHLIGDYITQSDWMANGKTSKYVPAMAHATVYSLPFLLLRPSWTAFGVILVTHFFIDRFRLAKYVVWAKNRLVPMSERKMQVGSAEEGWTPVYRLDWSNCTNTGYPDQTPAFLSVWLMIIADNTMHLTINYLALRYL